MSDEGECNVLDISRLYSIFRKAIFPWRWTVVPQRLFSPDTRVKISAGSAQILTKKILVSGKKGLKGQQANSPG